MKVIFTWDDNFKRHILLTAPLFEKYGFRCTFYVVPGEDNYLPDENKELAAKGFEVASHGYTHDDFLKMDDCSAERNMIRSIEAIEKTTGIRPETFAFPYHRFDDALLKMALKYFSETRNTLLGAVRYDILSSTSFEDMRDAIMKAGSDGKSIVFAGHAAVKENDGIKEPPGYEPIRYEELEKCLRFLSEEKGAEVVKMAEAAKK